MNKIFSCKPVNKINDIWNFIDAEDDYIEDYEMKGRDKKDHISLETKILKNLCQVLITNKYDKVIDVGCGNGHIINNIKTKYRVAVDISSYQLNNVNSDVIKVRCNVEKIPIQHSFNVVICTDVFEHVKKPDKLVDEIYRLLRVDGRLLFAIPWKQDLSVYETKEYKEKYGKYKYVHLRRIDEKTLKTFFTDRFDIISETEIDAIKDYMTLKPYSVKFIYMKKR